jgi:hypothetical protein
VVGKQLSAIGRQRCGEAMRVTPACYKEIEAALHKYRQDIEATNLTRTTKNTYLLHSENFVRWLEGKFEPGSRKK